MDEHVATPAGRLWLYFTHLGAQLDPNIAIRQAAASYFNVDAADTATYMAAMSQLVGLPDDVERQVSSIDSPTPPARVLLRPLARVREVLHSDPLGNNPIHWLVSQVTQDVLDGLETTSYVLMHQQPAMNPEIALDDLAQIYDLAQQIIALARESDDLAPEAQEAFIRFGHRISEAADMYKVAGAQPLIDELDRFHYENTRLNVPREATVWTKFKQVTAAVVAAVNLFAVPLNVHNALEGYTKIFELPEVTVAPEQAHPLDVIDAVLEDDEV